jgi:hypothetical protein
MSESAKRRGARPPPRWTPKTGGWTGKQVKQLGTERDEVIAKRIGRSVDAVASKRVRMRISGLKKTGRRSSRLFCFERRWARFGICSAGQPLTPGTDPSWRRIPLSPNRYERLAHDTEAIRLQINRP